MSNITKVIHKYIGSIKVSEIEYDSEVSPLRQAMTGTVIVFTSAELKELRSEFASLVEIAKDTIEYSKSTDQQVEAEVRLGMLKNLRKLF